ncbi:MAG: 4-(cytidine 5'-diphospho)-2-C-methyl-D-erythritol kinase [Candidatus Sericytochromatia bacterium]|nr:4-(cytidine 5'-diphospho)-2-C-methyl-D-erythritol kinase [Candidatus Sericytochromatia bacterium]
MPCRTEIEGSWQVRAKLNLGLSVGPPDGTGYHPVTSLLVAIDVADVLHVARRPGPTTWRVSWAGGAPSSDLGPVAANLAHRAWELAGAPEGYAFHLIKHLPAGGGLGAGSADAAAILRLLASDLDWPVDHAPALARHLGADVAFFLSDGPAWATGRGEVLEALSPGPELHGVLACGTARVATAAAYRWLDAVHGREPADLGALRAAWQDGDAEGVLASLANDFTATVLARMPELAATPEALRAAGARRPLLAGSGASWAGWVRDPEEAQWVAGRMAEFPGWVRPFRTVPDPLQRMT